MERGILIFSLLQRPLCQHILSYHSKGQGTWPIPSAKKGQA
ncbi:hypothetical protein HMPREF1508_1022 [Shuttleworthella sp. MSX8B]|nr:hypothetical protein HMPREF1508_1022 [Shuttleworthia sp. MSX8B]